MHIEDDSAPFRNNQDELPTLNAIEDKMRILEQFLQNKADNTQSEVSQSQIQPPKKPSRPKREHMPPLPTNQSHRSHKQSDGGSDLAQNSQDKYANSEDIPPAQFTNALIRSIQNDEDVTSSVQYDPNEKALAPKFVPKLPHKNPKNRPISAKRTNQSTPKNPTGNSTKAIPSHPPKNPTPKIPNPKNADDYLTYHPAPPKSQKTHKRENSTKSQKHRPKPHITTLQPKPQNPNKNPKIGTNNYYTENFSGSQKETYSNNNENVYSSLGGCKKTGK
jgi:hypothetical protein